MVILEASICISWDQDGISTGTKICLSSIELLNTIKSRHSLNLLQCKVYLKYSLVLFADKLKETF